jgi:hypothetical protein
MYSDWRSKDGKVAWNGYGLDNRSRMDVFLNTTHYQVHEDGVKMEDHPWPVPLAYSKCWVYFVQYVYHSDLDHQELLQNSPTETYWLNQVPHSDERHWANFGMETLNTTDWSTTSKFIGDFNYKI